MTNVRGLAARCAKPTKQTGSVCVRAATTHKQGLWSIPFTPDIGHFLFFGKVPIGVRFCEAREEKRGWKAGIREHFDAGAPCMSDYSDLVHLQTAEPPVAWWLHWGDTQYLRHFPPIHRVHLQLIDQGINVGNQTSQSSREFADRPPVGAFKSFDQVGRG